MKKKGKLLSIFCPVTYRYSLPHVKGIEYCYFFQDALKPTLCLQHISEQKLLYSSNLIMCGRNNSEIIGSKLIKEVYS